MKIVTLPNEIIRQKSKIVELPLKEEDENIVKELITYIDESQKQGSILRPGIGIAAVQLGYLKRMFYVNFQFNEEASMKELLINPKIIKKQGYAALKDGEGCLSVDEDMPNQKGLVHRANKIIIEGYSYFKQGYVKYTLTGFPAIVFQHEYDHLEGKLFIDHINLAKPFDPLEKEELI